MAQRFRHASNTRSAAWCATLTTPPLGERRAQRGGLAHSQDKVAQEFAVYEHHDGAVVACSGRHRHCPE
jgi:hypothetical protein